MDDNQVGKYDRLRAGLENIALFTKPSTIQNVEPLTGRAESFIVRTARLAETQELLKGDYIFVEWIDDKGQVTRVPLPPRVADCIARQRDALTGMARRKHGRRIAQERKDRGELPGFMQKRGEA